MNVLLQIQNYQNGTSSGYPLWADILKDFLIPLGAALLAAFVAVKLFGRQVKHEKLKETEGRNQHRKDKLSFLSALATGCMNIITKQKGHIETFISEIESNPIAPKPMSVIPWDDLRRVSKELNSEDHLLAYVDTYNADRKNSIL